MREQADPSSSSSSSSSSSPPPPPLLLILSSSRDGTVEEFYTLSSELGRGATSIVYRCEEKQTQKPYAVKVLKKTVSGKGFLIRKVVREKVRSIVELQTFIHC
uniref:Si:ch73-60h1.1 n=1 Tax=Salarias fasciatus TaxID=181472 RepID=A0A672GI93_SALFA